jgi:hypothetical protein
MPCSDPVLCRASARLTRASAPLSGDEGRPGPTRAVTTPAPGRRIHPQVDRRPHERAPRRFDRADPGAPGDGPLDLGTFLRAFTFGHVRQLDQVLDTSFARAWDAGAGPGELPLVIDIDSFVGEVHGDQKQGASYGYTRQLGYHRSSPCAPIPARCCTSATAKGRRTPSAAPPGSWMSCSRASVAPGITARSSSGLTSGLRTTGCSRNSTRAASSSRSGSSSQRRSGRRSTRSPRPTGSPSRTTPKAARRRSPKPR